MEIQDSGLIHVLGRMEEDGTRFHQPTQYSVQFRMHEMFIYGIFHLIFSEHG